MKMIVGLGNPGKEYEKTRHNVGYMVVDEIAKKLNLTFNQRKFKGLFCLSQKDDLILLKPETFMNNSGEATKAIMNYYKISIDDIVVVYDDLDLKVGQIRMRQKGSSGGQKGMKNIIDLLKSQEIKRVRLGIGNNKLITNYVITKFNVSEIEQLDKAIDKASEALIYYLKNNFMNAMNIYNKNEK